MRGGRIEQQGTPEELHASPRTQFVARFLGMRNVIPGEATPVSCARGAAELRMPDGSVLRARAPWPRNGAAASPAICFRPLDVELSPDPRPGQGGAGVVTQRLFLGDLVQITLRCNGYEIVAYSRPRENLAESARVHWRVSPERCVVIWS